MTPVHSQETHPTLFCARLIFVTWKRVVSKTCSWFFLASMFPPFYNKGLFKKQVHFVLSSKRFSTQHPRDDWHREKLFTSFYKHNPLVLQSGSFLYRHRAKDVYRRINCPNVTYITILHTMQLDISLAVTSGPVPPATFDRFASARQSLFTASH